MVDSDEEGRSRMRGQERNTADLELEKTWIKKMGMP